MPVKIMIDAGHGGYDNGATFGNRREKDEVLELALAVGEILQGQGYDVEYTRTTDVYDSPVQKARIGNESGADFFVSIHRNSSPTPNQYNGVQTLIYNDSGIKKTMAENINNRLEAVGYRNINVDIRPDLAVLRRTRMPAVLVEAGFINSDIDNNLFDTRFSETAEAIAAGIDETIRTAGLADSSMGTRMAGAYDGRAERVPVFADSAAMNGKTAGDAGNTTNGGGTPDYNGGMPNGGMPNGGMPNGGMPNGGMPNGGMPNGSGAGMNGNGGSDAKGYQILVGIYRGFGPASYQMNRLINEGYLAELFEDEGLFQVRVGAYDDIEDALIAQRELRDRGYETLIVRAE